VRHWRAYSLTSDPYREDGLVGITPKRVDAGKVSPYLVDRAKPGTIVSLSKIEGGFVLPDPAPPRLLFISAGSGVTPIMSMLRHLDHAGDMPDVVVLHSAREADEVMFGDDLRGLAEKHDRFHLHEQLTRENGRMGPQDLGRLCPDWRERDCYISGPNDMLDAFTEHFESDGDPERLHMERFQPKLGLGQNGEGEGGTIKFCMSDCEAETDGSVPILVAGEEAGLDLPFGCREGICHTCVGTLRSGQIRDLRNGQVSGQEGEVVRTCINAPEGAVEIEL
jgi:stearoyl-CoA 9-desaturase NADPH oxidoreductase